MVNTHPKRVQFFEFMGNEDEDTTTSNNYELIYTTNRPYTRDELLTMDIYSLCPEIDEFVVYNQREMWYTEIVRIDYASNQFIKVYFDTYTQNRVASGIPTKLQDHIGERVRVTFYENGVKYPRQPSSRFLTISQDLPEVWAFINNSVPTDGSTSSSSDFYRAFMNTDLLEPYTGTDYKRLFIDISLVHNSELKFRNYCSACNAIYDPTIMIENNTHAGCPQTEDHENQTASESDDSQTESETDDDESEEDSEDDDSLYLDPEDMDAETAALPLLNANLSDQQDDNEGEVLNVIGNSMFNNNNITFFTDIIGHSTPPRQITVVD